jgi:hypothetical protein
MAAYLILGAGRFGRIALTRLQACDLAAAFTVVDQNHRALQVLPGGQAPCRRVAGDAVAWLDVWLSRRLPVDWIIPAIGVHVAFAWLWRRHAASRNWRTADTSEDVARLAPLAIRGSQGELYLSLATARCPDNCREDMDHCPHPERAARGALDDCLARTEIPGWRLFLLPSRQLAPGAGGYRPARLLNLEEQVLNYRGNFFIATACHCHGVVHAIRQE